MGWFKDATGWDPVGDVKDAVDWVGDWGEGVLEYTGLKESSAAEQQASLAKALAAKNADLIVQAGRKESEALTKGYQYESAVQYADALHLLASTSKSVGAARDEWEIAVGMEDTAKETELESYRVNYGATLAKVATQKEVDTRSAWATRTERAAAADTARDITMGRAELDLNNDILMSELIANESINQATLTRTQLRMEAAVLTGLTKTEAKAKYGHETKAAATEFAAVSRDATTLFQFRTMAAQITAKYRTETELAKSVYEAVHSVAKVQARSGSSGFSGESGALVAQDLQNFYGGQITALQSNINAELALTMDNARSSFANTLTSANEKRQLDSAWAAEVFGLTTRRAEATKDLTFSQADQDYHAAVNMATNRQGLAETMALSTFTQTSAAASATRGDTIKHANLAYDANLKNINTIANTSETTATTAFEANANKVIKTHEGRVGMLDLNFETFEEQKRAELDIYKAKYQLATEFQADAYKSDKEWLDFTTRIESEIALNQGTITASSIKDAAAQSGFSRVATIATTAAAIA